MPDRDRSLRVAPVRRRDGSGWLLAHGRADPPARGIGLERAAVIARGWRAAQAQRRGGGQRPVKLGRRFSSMAATASLWSSVLWARAW